MTVLDASALLSPVHDEPGSDVVAERLAGSLLSTVNFAEVVGEVDADLAVVAFRQLLVAAGVVVEPLTAADAEVAGALRSVSGGRSLSLGDHCCLTLALRSEPAEVLTADRVWSDRDLPLTVHLLR